ncbi:MAG: YicC family protein [Yoonia sp.]|nr:YicC family protein [Yoonia sp.]
MIQSMTAFANLTGSLGAASWDWEIRGVNARGLDLRLRLPDGLYGLEAAARVALSGALNRGNVTLTLRLTRAEGGALMTLDMGQLDAVLAALDTVQERAFAMGVTLAQPNAADVLAQRGVMIQGQVATDDTALSEALQRDLTPLIATFVAMRRTEGAALHAVITDQLTQIAVLVERAEVAALARRADVQTNLAAALRRVLQDVTEIDDSRIAQELALLAVKADVTEEIDRLKSHVAAAFALLDDPKPAGRKLDFLAQEFNREANTLCSKAGTAALTAIGLDLKAVIDQMREQIQNIE